MLILSRKVGEKVMIGDNIVVGVQKVSGGRVSLSIEAPREVHVLRSELPVRRDLPGGSIAAASPSSRDAGGPH